MTPEATIGRLGPYTTLENPWKDNQLRVSCIPAGTYRCVRGRFNRGGYASFVVQDVPGRSNIVFHIGNRERDTLGCPLIGERLGVLDGELAVLASQRAFNAWMKSMEGVDEFTLTIREA